MLLTHNSSLPVVSVKVQASSLRFNNPNKSTAGNAHISGYYDINRWNTVIRYWLSLGEMETFVRAFSK